ncbi:hypothetical protein GA0115255_126271 [Streptomyces sp. Ncost-T6T-2b]|nr:hypothetical protein GA0115255_126271 [Streptomyces sp. Ncost-T6T-2b]
MPVSPMWDDEPARGSGICAACAHVVDDGPVQWIPRMTGPDIRIVVHDPGHCLPGTTDSRLDTDPVRPGWARPHTGHPSTTGGST